MRSWSVGVHDALSSRGATSFINFALFVVERLLGPQVAWAASRMFLVDPNKAPQGAYARFCQQVLCIKVERREGKVLALPLAAAAGGGSTRMDDSEIGVGRTGFGPVTSTV